MDPQGGDANLPAKARARRALTVIAISMAVIVLTGIGYLRPSLVFGSAPSHQTAVAQTGYQLAAVDFVSPEEGWFAATFDSGRYALLHTSDAGGRWDRQLSGATGQRSVYVDFFDRAHGLLGLLGPQSMLLSTADGGRTWSSKPVPSAAGFVMAAAFVDPEHGWLLVRSSDGFSPPALLRTRDGGAEWTNLGSPVEFPDQAMSVHFTNPDEGWMETVSAGPYAYRSDDAGSTWRQVPLPTPPGGWPPAAQYFVAAQPTLGAGVIASVASFTQTVGRTGIGEKVVAFPPLTVHAYDGGVPVSYIYATVIDSMPGSGLNAAASQHRNGPSRAAAPNQVQFGSLDGGATWSVIAPPSAPGAIGYSDARSWWWIGSGSWATSSDGGMTWTPYRNLGVPQPIAGSLQVLDRDHAWFGAMAGTVAVLETTADRGFHWKMIGLPPVDPG